jgi:hypothetical protein
MVSMSDVRESVLPGQVRAAQLLLFALAFIGLVVVLARSGGLTSYGLGEMVAPWLFVWVCALLALTYGGGARGGVRITTIVLLLFMLLPAVSRLSGVDAPLEFLDAGLRIVLGAPALVLLFLNESRDWFERER